MPPVLCGFWGSNLDLPVYKAFSEWAISPGPWSFFPNFLWVVGCWQEYNWFSSLGFVSCNQVKFITVSKTFFFVNSLGFLLIKSHHLYIEIVLLHFQVRWLFCLIALARPSIPVTNERWKAGFLVSLLSWQQSCQLFTMSLMSAVFHTSGLPPAQDGPSGFPLLGYSYRER